MADDELLDLAKTRGAEGIRKWRARNPATPPKLIEADLRGADLHGADLRGADLRMSDLIGANLAGVNMFGADLRRADLRLADLTRANLSAVNLFGADLDNANLSMASLIGANLAGANLRRALHLDEAVGLPEASWDDLTLWPDGFEPPTRESSSSPDQKPDETGEGDDAGDLTVYPFGVLPEPMAEAIAMAIEPLEGEWHRELNADYSKDTRRRVESCFSTIRNEARSGRADALTVFRQLQMLTEALGTDDTEEWAEVFRAFTETRTPEAPEGASGAADRLDDALAKIPAAEPDKTLTRIGKEAFVESYGGGLGKWAAGLTAGVLAAGTIAGAHAVGGVDIAATAVGLGRWVLEVLKLSQAM